MVLGLGPIHPTVLREDKVMKRGNAFFVGVIFSLAILVAGSVMSEVRNPGVPPYMEGSSVTNVTTATVAFGFAQQETIKGCWGYTMWVTSGRNKSNMTVKYLLEGVTIRTLTLGPGGSICDYVVCDSIYTTKGTAIDTLIVGGWWNR